MTRMTNDLRNHTTGIRAGLLIYLIEALEHKVKETERSLIRCYMDCSNISLSVLSESAELNY